MNRKQFIKIISEQILGLGIVLFLFKDRKAVIPRDTITIVECYIAGYFYYEGAKIENLINKNDILYLKRERQNIYDNNAIEVFWRQNKLGYIPRIFNKTIRNIMDAGIPVYSRIKEKYSDFPTYKRINIEILIQKT